jgi:hypothetical protein
MKKKFNKKKLLATLLVGVMTLVMVNAGLVYYLSNTIRAEATIIDSIECYFGDSGTPHYNLGVIQKDGEPIEINYTQVSKNIAESVIYTFPVTMIQGPIRWEGNEFDDVLVDGVSVMDKLYYVDAYGKLHPFSEIGEDDNFYSTVKLFIDKNDDGIAQKYPLSIGRTPESVIMILNPNVASGYYSIGYCHLNEISEQCDDYYYYF